MEDYIEDIVNGSFPLSYLDHKFIKNRRERISKYYHNWGYDLKDESEIMDFLDLTINQKKMDTLNHLYYASRMPYYAGSNVHPDKSNLIAYSNPWDALYELIPKKTQIKTGIKNGDPYIEEERENEFSKLKDRVDQQEQRISTSFQQKAQQGIGLATQGIGYAQALGGATAGAGSIMARIQGIAGKAFIPISVIMTVMEIASTVLNEALKPGGPLDRRFKRIIGDEIAATADLEFKEQVNQGFKVIRISTQPGLSGDAGVTSNLQKRTTIYDLGISRSMAGLQG